MITWLHDYMQRSAADTPTSWRTTTHVWYASPAARLHPQWGVNSMPPAHLHVRPMWALSTCRRRRAGEIKENTHPKIVQLSFWCSGAAHDAQDARRLHQRQLYPRVRQRPQRAVLCCGWVCCLIPFGGQAPHVLRDHMRHTCGVPNGIDLTAAHEPLNGGARAGNRTKST